ncbi:MAG: class I SAM-dependent methyltransferase [Bdellovibrionales bacterium]|nr:class I SAM-dependent methyltransferase [Bdellovibrionales bacterium]
MSSGHCDAAQDYADFLMALNEGQTPTDVLDLGAGDGSFLAELQRRGAQSLSGIEASLAAMERAPPQIRSIIEPIFLDPRSASFQEWVGRHSSSAGYLTCFQLIEHLHEPLEVLRAARGTLRPGGYLLIVSHDVSGWVQRLFRSRSPLLDVEHFQLFSKKTLADLLRRAGFESVQVSSFSNRHSVAHWLQLSPLPSPLRQRLAKVLIRARLADCRLRAPAVNVVGLARF